MKQGKIDQLEEFVRSNHDKFDQHEPPKELWGKIEKRIVSDEKETKVVRLNIRRLITGAAAVIAIFFVSYLIHFMMYPERHRESIEEPNSRISEAIDPAVEELVETEAFYTSQIDGVQGQLEEHLVDHPEIAAELKTEFKYLDSLYFELKDDLNDNAANERVIEAMIQNHMVKLQILEEMLLQIKISKNEVNTSENEELYEI